MAQGLLLTDMGAIDVSLPAAIDLSALQYHAMKTDSNLRVTTSGANDKSLGILQNKPAALDAQARVRIQGVSLAKVSEAVTLGKYLTPTAAGKLEVCDAAGEDFLARALGTWTTDDLAEVQLAFGEVEASDA